MSEGTRKKLCGASSNGIGAPRSSDVNTGILDEHVLALVFRSINFDLGWWPPSAAHSPTSGPHRRRVASLRRLRHRAEPLHHGVPLLQDLRAELRVTLVPG
jgi:hypothetical protein